MKKQLEKYIEKLLSADLKYLDTSRSNNAKLFLEGRITALKDLLQYLKNSNKNK